jgi:hypothetical protein
MVSLVLLAMIQSSIADYQLFNGQVQSKESELRALNEQLSTGRKRLANLQWEKGRTQSLVEHGYVRPGDRILLFPATPEEQRRASRPANDLSPHPAPLVNEKQAVGTSRSAWRRAGDTLSGWWKSLRGAATDPAPTRPASSQTTPRPPLPAQTEAAQPIPSTPTR